MLCTHLSMTFQQNTSVIFVPVTLSQEHVPEQVNGITPGRLICVFSKCLLCCSDPVNQLDMQCWANLDKIHTNLVCSPKV